MEINAHLTKAKLNSLYFMFIKFFSKKHMLIFRFNMLKLIDLFVLENPAKKVVLKTVALKPLLI